MLENGTPGSVRGRFGKLAVLPRWPTKKMSDAERFEKELEVFRGEVETAAQFFYSWLSLHEVAKQNDGVLDFFNENALFWTTVSGSLQTSALIALGRVFDQGSRHNLDAMFVIAKRNPAIFSKAELAKRKKRLSSNAAEWIDDYLKDVYEPKPSDFRRLRRHIKKYRKIYERNYRDLRHKVFAHKEVAGGSDLGTLTGRTNVAEMQRLFVFLLKLYESLWQLLFNGRKPILRPLRYSASRIIRVPSISIGSTSVHERIAAEVEKVLLTATAARQAAAPDRGHGNLLESKEK